MDNNDAKYNVANYEENSLNKSSSKSSDFNYTPSKYSILEDIGSSIHNINVEESNNKPINIKQNMLELELLIDKEDNLLNKNMSTLQNNKTSNQNNIMNKTKLKKHAKEHFDKKKEKENDPKYKSELCKTFIETKFCPYGNSCRFAHGKSDLMEIDNNYHKEEIQKYKRKNCVSFHTKGMCLYGKRCNFIHNEDIYKNVWNSYFHLKLKNYIYIIMYNSKKSINNITRGLFNFRHKEFISKTKIKMNKNEDKNCSYNNYYSFYLPNKNLTNNDFSYFTNNNYKNRFSNNIINKYSNNSNSTNTRTISNISSSNMMVGYSNLLSNNNFKQLNSNNNSNNYKYSNFLLINDSQTNFFALLDTSCESI